MPDPKAGTKSIYLEALRQAPSLVIFCAFFYFIQTQHSALFDKVIERTTKSLDASTAAILEANTTLTELATILKMHDRND